MGERRKLQPEVDDPPAPRQYRVLILLIDARRRPPLDIRPRDSVDISCADRGEAKSNGKKRR